MKSTTGRRTMNLCDIYDHLLKRHGEPLLVFEPFAAGYRKVPFLTVIFVDDKFKDGMLIYSLFKNSWVKGNKVGLKWARHLYDFLCYKGNRCMVKDCENCGRNSDLFLMDDNPGNNNEIMDSWRNSYRPTCRRTWIETKGAQLYCRAGHKIARKRRQK